MPERPGGHDYTLSSVRNALRLLCAFTPADRELGVSELARRLGLGKSAVHRLLTTLVQERFVERNPATGRYRLGIKLHELGAIVASHLDLHEAVAPHLDDLRNATGETVHVAILDGDEVVYVERRESPHTLRLFTRVGHRNRAHCTSTGKVLLAHLPPDELDRIVAMRPLERKTPYTITDVAQLREELERVRRRGFATNVNESEMGVVSVAAPIRDASGRVVAAVSTAGPELRLARDDMRSVTIKTLAAAARISERLGYRPEERAPGEEAGS